jgi:hypothetical protein
MSLQTKCLSQSAVQAWTDEKGRLLGVRICIIIAFLLQQWLHERGLVASYLVGLIVISSCDNDRPTDRPTDRPKDRPTDRLTSWRSFSKDKSCLLCCVPSGRLACQTAVSIQLQLYTVATAVYSWHQLQLYTVGTSYSCIHLAPATAAYSWHQLQLHTVGTSYSCIQLAPATVVYSWHQLQLYTVATSYSCIQQFYPLHVPNIHFRIVQTVTVQAV